MTGLLRLKHRQNRRSAAFFSFPCGRLGLINNLHHMLPIRSNRGLVDFTGIITAGLKRESKRVFLVSEKQPRIGQIEIRLRTPVEEFSDQAVVHVYVPKPSASRCRRWDKPAVVFLQFEFRPIPNDTLFIGKTVETGIGLPAGVGDYMRHNVGTAAAGAAEFFVSASRTILRKVPARPTIGC